MIETDKLIMEEISKILKSSYFKRSKRLCKLLSAIMNKTLSGKNHLLKEYTLGLEVFGLNKEYNPIDNPIVRVTVGNVRKKLNEYYENEGKVAPITIEIPKSSYIPIIHKNITKPGRLSDKPEVTEKITLLIVPQWNFNREKADPFLFSLVHNLCEFKSINVSLDKFNNDTTFNDYDFKLILSLYNESDEILFLLNLVDYQTGIIIWHEKFYYCDSYHSYIKWLDYVTKKASIIIGSDFGIIQKYRAENIGDENSLFSQAMFSFIKIFHKNFHSISLNNSLEKTQKALEAYPHNINLISNYNSLCSIESYVDRSKNYEPLDESEEQVFQMITIDPRNPIAQISFLRRLFARGKMNELFKESQNVLNSNNLDYLSKIAALSFLLFNNSVPEKTTEKIKSLMELSPYYPKFYHSHLCIYYYRMGEYSKALEELRKSPQSDVGYYMIILISLLGNMNRVDEAQTLLKNFKVLKPDLELNSHCYFPKITLENGVFESIEQGLRNIS